MDSVTSLNNDRKQDTKEKPQDATTTNWLKNEDKEYISARQRITTRFTQFIAATYIANADFPQFDFLPKLKPFPFTTFGHQPYLDYRRLQLILWDVISKVRSTTKNWASVSPFLTVTIFVTAGLIGVMVANISYRNEEAAVIVAVLFFSSCMLGKYFYAKNLLKRVAKVRANALEKLLHGKWDERSTELQNKFIDESDKYVGSGEIGGTTIPVVTIKTESQPFPGFGRLQAEESYLCRPTGNTISKPNSVSELSKNILVHVKSQLSASGIKNVRYGEIVVMHSNTLRVNSPWLSDEKRPLLQVNRDDVDKFIAKDPLASVREYFVVEVLFEEFMTTAYFFFRPFLAGNAASCHLAVSTLGPPATTVDHLEQVLLRYKLKEKNENTPLLAGTFQSTKLDLNHIHDIRSIIFDRQNFQSGLDYKSIKTSTIDHFYKLTNFQKQEYRTKYNQILEENIFWPGMSITSSPNTREELSLTFTNDFFGRPESITSVKAIYDQISRAILDALKEKGYEVSDYTDSEGNYTIRADKIDSLVVGENIQIKQSDKKSEQTNTTMSQQETVA